MADFMIAWAQVHRQCNTFHADVRRIRGLYEKSAAKPPVPLCLVSNAVSNRSPASRSQSRPLRSKRLLGPPQSLSWVMPLSNLLAALPVQYKVSKLL